MVASEAVIIIGTFVTIIVGILQFMKGLALNQQKRNDELHNQLETERLQKLELLSKINNLENKIVDLKLEIEKYLKLSKYLYLKLKEISDKQESKLAVDNTQKSGMIIEVDNKTKE